MSQSLQAVPVFDSVDLLIVGGTSGGVALALEAHRQGLRVFVAGARPFLGDDIVGHLRLWADGQPQPTSQLARAVYPDASQPITPMHAKLTLEQSLVQADIPFLLNVHPAAVLRADDGRVRGAVLATRSGRLAVRAKQVVDATSEAALARLAGLDLRLPQGEQTVLHTALYLDEVQEAEGIEVAARPADVSGIIGNDPYTLSARTYRLKVDFSNGSVRDLARAEAQIVERCWTPHEFQHQEQIRIEPAAPADAAPLTFDSVPAHDGLLIISPAALPGLAAPIAAMNFASEIAAQVVEQSRQQSATNAALTAAAAGARPVEPGEIRTQLDAPCREGLSDTVAEDANQLPVLGRCDVLVLGGGTAGAPACIGASRAGADTIVVEATSMLGGVGTAGQIAKYYYGNRVGFTSEVDRHVAQLEVDDRYKEAKGSWSVAAKTAWYHRESHRLNVTMFFRSICCGAWVDGDRVRGLIVATSYGYGLIEAGCVVDASGCADVAAAAGADTTVSGHQHVAVQGTGLAGIRPGKNYHNTDHNFFDDTDVVATTAAWVSSKLKFKDHFDSGQLIDSRERRQIIGDVTLGPADLLADRRYPDTVCVASSNFDSHGFTVHPLFMVKPPDKETLWADVPFRALLPRGLDRVLTTGLGVSCHRDALPVIRMQADVQNQGYAAGHIAAISAKTDTPLRKIDIRAVQKHLVEISSLPQRVLTDEDNFPVSDAVLQHAVDSEWDTYRGLALIFSEPQRATPMLKRAYDQAGDEQQRLTYAVTLGLLGDATGASYLRETLENNGWDEGWNYRGMGQFGFSLSPVDVQLIALAACGDAGAWATILQKASALPDEPAFSHCRAVAVACETLYPRHPNADAPAALAELLRRPGMAGHHQQSLKDMQAALTENSNETGVRNVALRELHLARSLYRCGDSDGLGSRVLQNYSRDIRAHFARHARVVLAERKPSPEFALQAQAE